MIFLTCRWPSRAGLVIAAALSIAFATTTLAPAADASSAAVSATKRVNVRGAEFTYREIGEGPPIVMLQRFRGNLDDWDPAFIDNLAKERTVIVFNNSGVASSGGAPDATIKAMADNAVAFMDALGIQTADILGWSMGGFVAQVMAIDHPGRVEKLVLVGTGPGARPDTPPPSEGVFGVATRAAYGFEEQEYLFFSDAPRVADLVKASVARTDAARRDDEPVSTPELMQAQAKAIEHYWFDPSTGYGEKLGSITRPTLIVAGDRDPFFNVDGQAALLKAIPSAQLSVYPLAGHGPHHQHPDRVAAEILTFLR